MKPKRGSEYGGALIGDNRDGMPLQQRIEDIFHAG
jgi:hypothetical protein